MADGVGSISVSASGPNDPTGEVTVPATDADGPLPARIGRYTIERKLGEGGMGVVYAARDQRLARTIALKMLSAPAPDETARQRLWREARAAASVNHPNICQIYEIGEDAGRLFIAMELLEGEALATGSSAAPLDRAESRPIGLGILSALAALHARGIVHRDLKPSNVFLTRARRQAARLRPGPARARTLATPGRRADADGHVMGTPRYMSPEQVDRRAGRPAQRSVRGRRDPVRDAGRPPGLRRPDRSSRCCTRRCYEQPPALTGSPAVTAVDRVIRRAMAKRPADRPVSADAMADELARSAASRARVAGDGAPR